MAVLNASYIEIDNDKVVIETDSCAYYASYEQYIKDGGTALPKGLTSISYSNRKGEETYRPNGASKALKISSAIKNFIIQVLASSHILSERYNNRLCDESKAKAAINLEQQRAEAEQNFYAEQQSLSLDEAKQQALIEFKKSSKLYRAYENSLVYFKSHLGFRFNGDQRSLDTMKNLYDTFDRQALVNGMLPYLDYDNVYRNLRKDDLQLLILESQANLFKLFKDIQSFKSKIKGASDKSELYSDMSTFTLLAFEYVPSDFSTVNLLTTKASF